MSEYAGRLNGCDTHRATQQSHVIMHNLRAMRATVVRSHAINRCAGKTCAHDACSSWRAHARRIYVWPQRARLRCMRNMEPVGACDAYKCMQ
eukprot:6176778-Pleurochrysis_carterae.AAC.1